MTSVFADTSFYVALVNRRDNRHADAVSFLRGFGGEIVTTECVLIEFGNFHSKQAIRHRFVRSIETIRNDALTRVVRNGIDWFERGLDLFTQRPDKDWSLTDCISFEVMREERLTDALTADRHFEQAGFNVLLG
jgi:uncharacterized protein